jgi:hypothetical protein
MDMPSPSFLPANTPQPAPTPSPAQMVAQPPPQNAVPVQTKIPVTSDVDRRLQWHVAAWWVMFILLLVSWFAIGLLVLNETNAVRHDAQHDTDQLGQQLNDSSSAVQSRIDTRATTLDSRIDEILRDNALLRSELSALEVRVAQQESTCQQGCSIGK